MVGRLSKEPSFRWEVGQIDKLVIADNCLPQILRDLIRKERQGETTAHIPFPLARSIAASVPTRERFVPQPENFRLG